jgi:hypothetical protein
MVFAVRPLMHGPVMHSYILMKNAILFSAGAGTGSTRLIKPEGQIKN